MRRERGLGERKWEGERETDFLKRLLINIWKTNINYYIKVLTIIQSVLKNLFQRVNILSLKSYFS